MDLGLFYVVATRQIGLASRQEHSHGNHRLNASSRCAAMIDDMLISQALRSDASSLYSRCTPVACFLMLSPARASVGIFAATSCSGRSVSRRCSSMPDRWLEVFLSRSRCDHGELMYKMQPCVYPHTLHCGVSPRNSPALLARRQLKSTITALSLSYGPCSLRRGGGTQGRRTSTSTA